MTVDVNIAAALLGLPIDSSKISAETNECRGYGKKRAS